MCKLIRKTKKETVTVYKTVLRVVHEDGEYYTAFFSGVRIKLGKVKQQTREDKCFHRYIPGTQHWNEIMVGKSSGFANLKPAIKLGRCTKNSCVLKIVLGGEIWEGDASRIAIDIDFKEKIYAGTEILSFEEVKL